MVALGEVDGNASKSEAFETEEAAVDWIAGLLRAALGGVDPTAATMKLADYGTVQMTLALRGLEAKTLDPYLSGWRKRVVPVLGHLPVRMITNGAVDGPCSAGSLTEAAARR